LYLWLKNTGTTPFVANLRGADLMFGEPQMGTLPLSDSHNQRSSDQVFYGILDHYYLANYDDPELPNTKVRITVGVIVFATTPDHETAKFLLRKNINQVVEHFEQELMSRLYH
jgi:hypothetical protein